MTIRIARLFAGSVMALAVGAAWAADAPAIPATSAGADPAVIRFDIARFDVSGNTLLEAAEIDAALAPFAGQGRSFGDVQRALDALEARYHARGYNIVTVQLPEQELNGGVVKLRVVQTRIGQIKVSGNQYNDQSNVLRALPTLTPGQSPNLHRVSSNLRLANENPARKITMRLQNGGAEDEVDALLDVSDEKPWKAMLNLDNNGTAATGKTHVSAVLQHANLWGRDHVGSFQYTTTAEEPSKVSVYGLGYHIPLYSLGDSVDLYASYSNIDSGTVSAGVFDLAVSGRGSVAGARYNQSLARSGAVEQRLIYGIDVKAFKNSVLFGGENLANDVTVHPLSLGYSASMPLAGGEANLAVTLVHNLPGGSRGGAEDFARVRAGAKASYNLLRFGAAFNRSVATDWQARLLVNGQLSADALVPGEQFGAGGSSSVRGMDERALSTDAGIGMNLELYTPNLCAVYAQWQCRVLAFYDAAHGKRNRALAGEIDRTSVASVGLGWRWSIGNAMNMQLDFGHVVNAGALALQDKNKVHVRVGLAY